MEKDVLELTTDEFFDSIRGLKDFTPQQKERFFKEVEDMIKQVKGKHGTC